MKDKYETTEDLESKKIVYSPYHKSKMRMKKNSQFASFNRTIVSHIIALLIFVLMVFITLYLNQTMGIFKPLELYILVLLFQGLILAIALNYNIAKRTFLKHNANVFVLNDGILFSYAFIRTLFGKFANPIFIPFEHIGEIKLKQNNTNHRNIQRFLFLEIKEKHKNEYPETIRNFLAISDQHVPSLNHFKIILEKQMKKGESKAV